MCMPYFKLHVCKPQLLYSVPALLLCVDDCAWGSQESISSKRVELWLCLLHLATAAAERIPHRIHLVPGIVRGDFVQMG